MTDPTTQICDLCGSGALVFGPSQPPHSCVCGGQHRFCWPCCRRHELPWQGKKQVHLEMCLLSDEFKVADVLMREERPDPDSLLGLSRSEAITVRRRQLFDQQAAKRRAAGGSP